jgi:hypothetical protein
LIGQQNFQRELVQVSKLLGVATHALEQNSAYGQLGLVRGGKFDAPNICFWLQKLYAIVRAFLVASNSPHHARQQLLSPLQAADAYLLIRKQSASQKDLGAVLAQHERARLLHEHLALAVSP